MALSLLLWLGLLAIAALPSAAPNAASPPPVVATDSMVVTAQALATRVGQDILARGGNAVDAAVSAAYALAVVHPCCGNLGGGGFMTIHLAAEDREVFIDFRETAPAAATRDMFLGPDGAPMALREIDGYLPVGVPGTVMGLDTALARYGTMDREAVMAPAIELAENGYVLTVADSFILAYGTDAFAAQPNVARIFLKNGRTYEAGERLIQSDLAASLELIARGGPEAFYEGSIAERIVAASTADGGVLSLEDFAGYRVVEREPVRCTYRGYEIVSAPPPSSGGTTICMILSILEGYPLSELGFNSAATIHLMAEAMARAYHHRNRFLGDPAFVDMPLDRLLSKDYATQLRAAIPTDRITPPDRLGIDPAAHEGADTTHLSVRDKDGNAVALTYTINYYFGVKRIAGDTGFFLNNELGDFTFAPGVPNHWGVTPTDANAVAPGKRPLSSMSPTLVTKDGRVVLVLGSPGGPRIITIVTQGIINVVDFKMNMAQAVNAQRVHYQGLPPVLFHEPRAFTRDTAIKLESLGYTLDEQVPWGALEAVMIEPPRGLPTGPDVERYGDDSEQGSYRLPGLIYGANDARRPAGLAAGE